MRQFLFASVALLALAGAGTARAADMPPDVIYPAGYPARGVPYPVATGPFLFTGFYAGANVGGALGGTKFLETPSGAFPSATAVSIADVGTSSTAPRGVIGGLEAGYNWQIGHFLLGIETDFSGWDMSSNSEQWAVGGPVPILTGAGGVYTSSGTVTSNWLYTLRPRVGFVNGNMLTYLTAGLAVTNFRFSESITLGSGLTPNGPSLAGSASNTVAGWVAGGGVEYALSYNWFIKAEYLYASFSNQTAAQTTGGFPSLTGTATANLNANILRGGFDYRF
jgi:outer membrane immunogenic protein